MGLRAPCQSVPVREVEGELTEGREILWPVPLPDPALALAERDVEHPMERVLDPPMGPDSLRQAFGVSAQAADGVAGVGRGRGVTGQIRLWMRAAFCHLDDGSQGLPHMAIGQLQLSARAFHPILNVSRAIADLAGADGIAAAHMAAAL